MTAALSRIGLGTAQFGLDYGITNTSGRVEESEAERIIERAAAGGVDLVDTAYLYGDSEAVLGRLTSHRPDFKIVTKAPKLGSATSPSEARQLLRSGFEESLARLRRPSVYGLLLHDPADLLGKHGEAAWSEMECLKELGKVARIGVSIYAGAEIDLALQRFQLDLLQLPYNPLDLRLVEEGQFQRLQGAKVEVHARSVFLQGLLLQPAKRIEKRFAPIAAEVRRMEALFQEAGLTRLEGVLALAFQRREIARFICGVTRAEELDGIILAAERAEALKDAVRFHSSQPLDARYLNPSRWDELQ